MSRIRRLERRVNRLDRRVDRLDRRVFGRFNRCGCGFGFNRFFF